MFYNLIERSHQMNEELLEVLRLFQKADKDIKTLVVTFLKSPSQERDLLRKHFETDEQIP